MGATSKYKSSSYQCSDYQAGNTGRVIRDSSGRTGSTTQTSPITCYSHSSLTSVGSSTSSTCSGHRKVNASTRPTEPTATASYGGIIYASTINNIRDAIAAEITQRKQHAMYTSISNAEARESVGNIAYKSFITALQAEITNADKEERGYPTKSISFNPTSKPLMRESDVNTLKDITIEVIRDCICYSDCNSYSVCWCYGYCYDY